MDYEKKYKEALEGVQEILSSGADSIKMSRLQLHLQGLFPELKESEDERIRKALITYFQRFPYGCIESTGTNAKEAIAWLEKQCEQNPANKVEPKFNVGDWVVTDKDTTVQIGAVNNGYYTINNGMDFSISYVDKHWRLWTIKDAKDGDILYYKSDNNIEYIVMNKGINMHGHIDSYFRYNSLDGFAVDVPSVLSAENDNITLATKEQRDLLFQKMEEAGYEWNAEKKALKKIMLNLAWSEEDYSKVQRICQYLNEAKKYYGDITEVRECIEWLESLKQRTGGEK